ncbi:restriction endonuclease subunit S [Emticicia fluvialis]|uniref:restriction endonuclease subunit S n=1 Tax=Emticicia fluvialis TaxID=2974474 RepID=UPI0021655AFD|nr:restriction endonuclease subunit S [Emticicia fluvialis]
MELSAGYKNTEVGVFPEDWEVKTIGEISTSVRGGSPRPAGDPRYFNGNFIPWLTVAALTNIPVSQIYVNNTESKLTEEGSQYSRILEKDTIIIANSGATLGVAKILGVKCCANDGIAALQNFNSNVSKEYLVHFLNTKIKYLREVVATGNGQPNLNTRLISLIKAPFPPTKAEQTAIASALSEADALISSLEKLIAKKRNIKQGVMQKLLHPKEGWEVKTYGEVFTFLPTATYSRAELTESGNVKYIHYGDIHTKWDSFLNVQNFTLPTIKNELLKNYPFIKEGDLIMADASEDYNGIGKSIEVRNVGAMKIISGLHTFLLRDNTSVFTNGFRGYIHSCKNVKEQFDRLATGLKVYGVSKNNLKTVQIPVPPLEEQIRIATILSDMDNEITALEAKLEKYRKVKLGMMQNLLTGKIRLI